MPDLTLRPVVLEDLPAFFEYQADPVANAMAAFTVADPNDREAFMAKWARILADDGIVARTIVVDGVPVGNVSIFPLLGEISIGYWIGRAYWGRGIAKAAVGAFLASVPTRPLHARVAEDNLASLSILNQCGFVVAGEDRGFANARGREIREIILILGEGELPSR
jgi:RimJ/RimL family protein N-acetyltransferase